MPNAIGVLSSSGPSARTSCHNALVPPAPEPQVAVTRFLEFSRAEWARLRASTPLPLTEPQLRALVGLNEAMSLDEVSDIYLPLSRLLNLYVAATRSLHAATATFLGTDAPRVPFVIGIAGSVAVGKSTVSRLLRALLSRWPTHPQVDLVTTDGFLLPQRVLAARGLLDRKGFPESYDLRALVRFMADVKAGVPEVFAPVYSHLAYDIVPGELQVVRQPDIVLVEGLNVLQTGSGRRGRPLQMFVSDFFDFSIYVDAQDADIEQWYIERFLQLRDTVFTDPSSYFHKYAHLSAEDAVDTARRLWRSINLINLRENVQPTRERAHLVLEKGRDHAVRRVRLRKI
jgi:type I pantothenate kinase